MSYDQQLKRISSLQENKKIIKLSIKFCYAGILIVIPVFAIFQNVITAIACIVVLLTNYVLYNKKLIKDIQLDTIYWVVPLFFYFTFKIYNEI